MLNIPIDNHLDVYATTRKGRPVITRSKAVALRFQRRYMRGKPSVIVLCLSTHSNITYRLVTGRIEME